ncbi:hypothetical protein Pint_13741 [Pistacia integerrima]|uniref:Uncharacterized protein n=1 Tax=Pistacia integerrima TaxID=434235 RepID=A0ACC0YAD1_9ROSI|nr:hypothetical protein Pint_13741 [Pistacia integerrima]
MKPQLFNLIFQLFGIDCEMWNIDPDEVSYIVLIKDMKTCVAEENEIVQLYPNEKFRIEAKLPWLYVDAFPVQSLESLQPLPEPNPNKPNDNETENHRKGFRDDDFHWSDASNEDDEIGSGFGGAIGNVDGEAGDNEWGIVFRSIVHFRMVLKDYIIQRGFAVRRVYNQKRRIKAVCKVEGCPFHIYAALMIDKHSYQIRKYEHTHTCLRVYNNPDASVAWIAEKMGDFIRSHKGCCVKPLDAELGRVHFLEIHKRKLYRARRIATGMTQKQHAESFAWLFKYTHILQVTNPRSMTELRYFIGIDGCHLKGYYGGVLLSPVSMDANNWIFPLAICVCEAENNDSWGFFLRLLHDFLGDLEHVTFMSDRQKGIINALQAEWPNARSRFCAWHVYANFRKNFPGIHLRKLFWQVSRAANRINFVEAMGMVKDVDENAHKWLLENEPDQWSRHAFDTTSKSDYITNNMSECFNSWLGEDRELPILSLLELYRCRVMKRLQCRFEAGTKWVTPLPPVVHRKINKLIESARNVNI